MKKLIISFLIAILLILSSCKKTINNSLSWGTQPNQFVCKCINLQVHDTTLVDMLVVNHPDTVSSRAYAVRLCDSLNSSVTSCSVN